MIHASILSAGAEDNLHSEVRRLDTWMKDAMPIGLTHRTCASQLSVSPRLEIIDRSMSAICSCTPAAHGSSVT